MDLPSSSFSSRFKYDVFLSFRGSDTRHGFTGNLWKALCERGINTFIDDENLERGSEITPSLVEAIKGSRIAIVVLSKNYAFSSFCLDELVNVVEHIQKRNRWVLPIFYDVEPSHVRHQTASYGDALAKHEEEFRGNKENMERLQKWRSSLHQIANLSGAHYALRNGYEYKLIGEIVKEISNKINLVRLHVADYPVGMESQIQNLRMLLSLESDDGAHMVGIYGMGGLGKTTLARAIYNLIADHFEGLCFLHNVRETSLKHGLEHLQERLLSKTVGLTIKLGDVNEGIPLIKGRLNEKKVLLILDDVNELEQLQVLVGSPDWFSPGSRIIITTRDKQLLVSHGITRTYEVQGLNVKESGELFRWHAFKNNNFNPSYNGILKRAVAYASGLPLALEVIGSSLSGLSVGDCESALDRYKRIPIGKIQAILKVSFDSLEQEEKSVFLDIACCFKGYKLVEVEYILNAHHGNNMKHHIQVLVKKSLIKVCGTVVTLHDLIEDMGKEIVRVKSPKEPGERSRLWHHEDIKQVFEDNTGTSEIEIIQLDFPLKVEWDGEAFKKMEKLRTLIIRNGKFSQGPQYLPSSLRVLEWPRYPRDYFPSTFHPKKLVVCNLPNNCFKSSQVECSLKRFVNVKLLNFDKCGSLTKIPDVSCLSNLEEFSFRFCKNLVSIHDSIGKLNKLRILKAGSCPKLKHFPPIKLTSLEELNLSNCDRLENFPEILVKMEMLTSLELQFTAIKELPSSFVNITRLRSLRVNNSGIIWLPSNIFMMAELGQIINGWNGCILLKQSEDEEKPMNSVVFPGDECLELSSCNLKDEYLPVILKQYANVRELDLSNNTFTNVPECIKECHFLWKLILDDCGQLEEIRGIPPKLKHCSALACNSLTGWSKSMLLNQLSRKVGSSYFCLPQERIPQWVQHRCSGHRISFWFRKVLPATTLCLVTQGTPNEYSEREVEVYLIINGVKYWRSTYRVMGGHAYFVGLNNRIVKNDYLRDGWNLAEVIVEVVDGMSIKESGIRVLNSHVGDLVSFTKPALTELEEEFRAGNSAVKPMNLWKALQKLYEFY